MLVDSTGTKGANLAFSITWMERKATNGHVFLRMVGEVEMSHTGLEASFSVNFKKNFLTVSLVILTPLVNCNISKI